MNKSKFLLNFICVFCPLFMILIFGPSETFFANIADFSFLWQDFGVLAVIVCIVVSGIVAILLNRAKESVSVTVRTICSYLSVAMYLQALLLNKNLSSMGTVSDGVFIPPFTGTCSLLLWIVLGYVFYRLFIKKIPSEDETVVKLCNNGPAYLSVFLFLIQAVALCSLMLTASERAYSHPKNMSFLMGTAQYEVSEDDNIIIMIMDMFSSSDWDMLISEYPEYRDELSDFTFYDDCNAIYGSTYPSVAHMVTGVEVNPEISTNEWHKEIWENENTRDFYAQLKNKGYSTKLFVQDVNYIYGDNNAVELSDMIDNVTNSDVKYETNSCTALLAMVNMSMYKYSMTLLKPLFYEDRLSDKTVTVDYGGVCFVDHDNGAFNSHLLEEGLSIGDSEKSFIVQHLRGMHNYVTDAEGNAVYASTRIDNARGCMKVLDNYFSELKRLGVYDNSTIIVTADHCHVWEDDDVIFFIKGRNETHGEMQVNSAPISHCDLLPTVASAAGISAKFDGKPVFEASEDDNVTRMYMPAVMDPEFPVVDYYQKTKKGTNNAYYKYFYTGGRDVLNTIREREPDEIIPMTDSFY